MLEPQPSRSLPHFIRSEQFVRMLRILRSAAPELIGIQLTLAFESQSPLVFTVIFVGGAVYIVTSSAHFDTLSEENKNEIRRKIFTFIDDALHANWMALRFVSSIVVTGVVIASKSLGPIIVDSLWFIPLEVISGGIALGYAITQALNIRNKAATILGSVLVTAQLSRILNVPKDIMDSVGFEPNFLYPTIAILASAGVAVALKLLEDGRPNIMLAQKVIQYASWLTYPLSVTTLNILIAPALNQVKYQAFSYTAEAIAATATVVGIGVLAKKYYDSTKSPEEVALIPQQKKTTIGCWSRMRTKLSNCCCWASSWRQAESTNNSNSMSVQTDPLAETGSNSRSLSLNSVAPKG